MPYLFTSESVTEGHPDKVCDQVSDAIVDAALAQDPNSRVACETLATTGHLIIAGEMTTQAKLSASRIATIARGVIRDIGYVDERVGMNADTCRVQVKMDSQSPDIAMGVDRGDLKEQGAGDQGMMFGYACRETPEFMPLSIQTAHNLTRRLAEVRHSGELAFLCPDGKSQVTVEYDDDCNVRRLHTVVISTQHDPNISQEQIYREVRAAVIDTVCGDLMDDKTIVHINPTGNFVVGGPQGDCGLTGRKIIVDTYGGVGRHGGGAFSGKDPSKVDRSAAYAARHVAKNIVAAGLADQCEVQLSYAIGVAKPLSVYVNTFGTSNHCESLIEDAVRDVFDLRPGAIIESLALRRPQYQSLAAYGHMGREDLNVRWEDCDRTHELLESVGSIAPSRRQATAYPSE
jgi:S-adenosylmethionine synthetase